MRIPSGFYQLFRGCDEPSGILEADQVLWKAGRNRVRDHSAYAATFFCCTSCVQRGRLKERAGDIRTFRYFNNTDVCTYESDCKCINRYRVVCRYTHNIIINRVFRIKSYWDLFAYQSSRFRTSFREQPCLKAIAFKSSNSGFSWFT